MQANKAFYAVAVNHNKQFTFCLIVITNTINNIILYELIQLGK